LQRRLKQKRNEREEKTGENRGRKVKKKERKRTKDSRKQTRKTETRKRDRRGKGRKIRKSKQMRRREDTRTGVFAPRSRCFTTAATRLPSHHHNNTITLPSTPIPSRPPPS
jgi:hypothetical protein